MTLLRYIVLGLVLMIESGCSTATGFHGIPNFSEVAPGVDRGGQPNVSRPTDDGWWYVKNVRHDNWVLKLNTESEGSDTDAQLKAQTDANLKAMTNSVPKTMTLPPMPPKAERSIGPAAVVNHRPPSGYTITNSNGCTQTIFTNSTPWQTNAIVCRPAFKMTLAWEYDTNHPGRPGDVYWIQSSPNLKNWSNYMIVDGHTTMLEVDTTNPKMFYRFAKE